MTTHFMIDTETLATDKTAAVLSVAIVPFDSDGIHKNDTHFYQRIARHNYSEFPSAFTISQETMKWWDEQTSQARMEAFSGILHPATVCEMIGAYIREFDGPKKFWAKGAIFDFPILENLLDVFGYPHPWNYRNSLCYRTLLDICPNVKEVRPTVAHNAHADAVAQAETAALILSRLSSKGV